MADVLTVVAKVRAAKGKGDALAALVTEQAAAVRAAEPGCLAYRAHRSPKDPDAFYFYEQYKDDAAHGNDYGRDLLRQHHAQFDHARADHHHR